MATPEQLGEMFKPYNLDIIGFSEVPDGDWTARVGKVLGMEHSYVGKISSANHKDKYKSILSRTPLEGTTEHELRVTPSRLLESCIGRTSRNRNRRCFHRILLIAYLWFGRTQR